MPGAGTSGTTSNTQKQQQESGNTASTTQGTQQVQQNTGQVQNTSSNVGPWGETQPLLSNILSSLNGSNTAVSPGQSEALAGLQHNANAIPNFGGAATDAVGNFIGPNAKYGGMLSGAVGDYGTALAPYTSASYLDPMTTPGLSDALGTMKSDITNSINGEFAAAGRDLSPANSTALARGLTQGMAPIIANQFNQNVATQRGAQDAQFGARAALPGMLSGIDLSGINAASQVPGLYTAPGQAQLGAANAAYAQPYGNIGMLEGLTTPLAGLGQTSSGTSIGSGTGSTTGNTTGSTTGMFSGQGSGTSNTQGTATMSPLAMLASLFGSGSGGSAAGMGDAAGKGIGMLAGLF